jgi:hypothetical protein
MIGMLLWFTALSGRRVRRHSINFSNPLPARADAGRFAHQ